MSTSKLIFAACGAGKSYFVKKYKHELTGYNITILDGDEILEKAGVKNRNYFWYGKNWDEQKAIIDEFGKECYDGTYILYSGNPLVLGCDIILIIDEDIRHKRVMGRKGFKPTEEQFEREERVYKKDAERRLYDEHVSVVRSFEELKTLLIGGKEKRRKLSYNFLLKYYNRMKKISDSGCVNICICEECGLPEWGGSFVNDMCEDCNLSGKLSNKNTVIKI